uniref:Uncharacterized protein n=1 Tax=Anguilla anguilla TaxID=7936 RepID=A0A0E9P911_ANGAN
MKHVLILHSAFCRLISPSASSTRLHLKWKSMNRGRCGKTFHFKNLCDKRTIKLNGILKK